MKRSKSKVVFNEKDHTYELNGTKALFSVTEVLQKAGLINYSFLSQWQREQAMSLGKAIHTATRYEDEKDLDEDSVIEAVHPYLASWRKFKKETGWENYDIEKPLFSPKLKIAGTPDRIGTMNLTTSVVPEKYLLRTTVLDIKKGKPQAAGEQTAGYQIMYDEINKTPLPIKLRMAVVLNKKGDYSLEFYEDDFDLVVFRSAYFCALRKEGLR